MPDNEDKWFEALHGDLKGLDVKVQRIENTLSEMKGERLGGRLEKLENKTQELSDFKSKVIGAMIILHSIWAIVAAYIIWHLTTPK